MSGEQAWWPLVETNPSSWARDNDEAMDEIVGHRGHDMEVQAIGRPQLLEVVCYDCQRIIIRVPWGK